MVQSISEQIGIVPINTKNSSRLTDKDCGNFSTDLEAAQSKLEANSISPEGASGIKNETPSSGEDLIKEFKSACMGISICGKCAAMYRGTGIAKCAKCGNDMKKENEKSQKTSTTDNADSAKGVGLQTTSTPPGQSVAKA